MTDGAEIVDALAESDWLAWMEIGIITPIDMPSAAVDRSSCNFFVSIRYE